MKSKIIFLIWAVFASAALQVAAQPVISIQPQSQTNVLGTSVALSVEATGAAPLYYQWRRGAATVVGETNAVLFISSLQSTNAGNYTVVVTNLAGGVTSTVAFVRVLLPPGLTTQPADNTAGWGATVTFQVVAVGTGPLSYQWRFNEAPLQGRTNTSLILTNVTFSNAGPYTLLITNLFGSITSRVARLDVPAPAILDAKLSANIRLGDDPPQLPANRRAQTEPHIARSYSNPNLLVAAFMEGTSTDAAVSCGYSVSTNGGLNWSRGLLRGLTRLDGGQYRIGADVTTAIDLQDRLFISSLVGNLDKPVLAGEQMVLSGSTGSGETFGPPVVIFRALGTSDGPDKSWLTINTFAHAPNANRIAATFAWMGRNNQTALTFSDDGGITWSAATPVGAGNATGSQPFFRPDGSLALVYWHFLGSYYDNNSSRMEIILSPDGGRTFGSTNVIQVTSDLWFNDPIAESGPQFPSACSDRQAGVIYLTYQAWNKTPTNRVRRILFTRSIDAGQTWSVPVPVSDTPAGRSVFDPVITVSPDGQHVLIAYYDKRNQTATSADNLVDYYLAESFDGGNAWEPNLRLTDVSSDLRLAVNTGRPSLGEYQGIVPPLNFDVPGVAVWIDTRSGSNDPYVVRIARTRGTTFDTWRRLRFSTNDLTNLALSGETADPEGDGLPNLAEYAHGLEPTRADPGPLKITQNSPGPLPMITVSYERLAVLSDIQFSWQTSASLVDWSPISPALEEVVPSRDPSMHRVEAQFPVGDQMRFFRLGVARLPPMP